MYESYQVLFVDDEIDILRSLKRGLIDEEYDCFFAEDGYKALEIMEQNKIAVIVADMKMPGMDGLQLLKQVRERWPNTVRIVLSGYIQLPQIILAINQAGIFQFITKPWRLEEEFIDSIRKGLDHYIQKEKQDAYQKKLESQKLLYLSMIRNFAKQARYFRKSIDFFSEVGKAIAEYENEVESLDTATCKKLRNTHKLMFDLFRDAIKSKREAYQSNDLVEILSHTIASQFQPANIIKLADRNIKISVYYKMIEAIIKASKLIFYDEFQASGVSARIGVEGNDYFCLYLVTSFEQTLTEDQTEIYQKLYYFSKVLEELSMFHLTCFAEKYSKKIVIGMFVNHENTIADVDEGA